jgi:hypothetical protein
LHLSALRVQYDAAMSPAAEQLRSKARELMREAAGFVDPDVKRELAERAFELAQRAERIDVLLADPERVYEDIARYRSILMQRSLRPDERRIFREALADAEAILR